MTFTRRNSIILAIGAAIIVIGLIVLFTGNGDGDDLAENFYDEIEVHDGLSGAQEVRNEEAGIAFTYQAGEGGYRLTEPPIAAYGEETMLDSYVLIGEEAYRAIEAAQGGTEGPPTMTVFIFENPENMSAADWAQAHTAFSNYELMFGIPETRSLNETEALYYRADGLYASDVYVVARAGKIYVLTGSFIEADSALRADFDTLLESVEFI